MIEHMINVKLKTDVGVQMLEFSIIEGWVGLEKMVVKCWSWSSMVEVA